MLAVEKTLRKERVMKKHKLIMFGCILALVLVMSVGHANQNVAQSLPLSQSAEVQAVGGDSNCMRAIGLGVSLALAALSPCGILCAVAAWYDFGLVAIYCG